MGGDLSSDLEVLYCNIDYGLPVGGLGGSDSDSDSSKTYLQSTMYLFTRQCRPFTAVETWPADGGAQAHASLFLVVAKAG